MSLSTIIKNVYTFGNILSQAGSEEAQYWDQKSMENALNWAKYCEKIAEQMKGKSYRDQLNQQLQSLTLLLTPVTLLDLSLDKLERARLCISKVLLKNSSVKDHLKQAVLTDLTDPGNGNSEEVKNFLKSREREDQSTSTACLTSLLGHSLSLEDTSEEQADLIIQSLSRLKKASNNTQRYTRFFEEFLVKLTSLPSGWEVILNVLLTDIDEESDHWYIEELKEEILHWIMKQNKLTCSLWKTDCDLLCNVSTRDDQFYNLYREHLLSWGQSMEPVYGMTEEGDLYKWCFLGQENEEKCFCYKNLVNHVSGLVAKDKNKRWNFESVITDLSRQSYFNIWKDILKSVKERLKFAVD